jgi:hypothetical protein
MSTAGRRCTVLARLRHTTLRLAHNCPSLAVVAEPLQSRGTRYPWNRTAWFAVVVLVEPLPLLE